VIIIHDPRCIEYSAEGHPECPNRVAQTAEHLRREHPDWEWQAPVTAPEAAILRAHSARHLARLEEARAFDVDTPFYDDIAGHARRAAGAAIGCAQLALRGERAFSLMRPPGHHAMREQAMGFCYLNSIAIAALDALATGVKRVAIWDFDAHHGNGTESLCEGDARLAYISVHEHPAYPHTGSISRENIRNFPLLAVSSASHQMAVLKNSWDCVLEFQPELILVSAGFDAYWRDPLASLGLHQEDFKAFGEWMAQTDIPCAAILEGGYSDDLPLLVEAFLSGWESRRFPA